jgi:hydrophobe/amphiphile efflux-1 (HAE1) family protein
VSAPLHPPQGPADGPRPDSDGPRAPDFVRFFIDRPIFAAVIAILITLAGAISIPLMPVSQFPPIAPPTVQVSASYTGASADVVERTITLPIEEQVNGVEGMLYMSSTSANDGQMNLTVTFEHGRDPDIATVNVNNRAAVAEPRLPEEVRRLGVTVRKQSPELTLVANLLSPDGSRDSVFLSNYALINVLDSLKRVPGVGDVGIFGERRYAMRIWLDPERLAKLGLTAGDIIGAVREQNVQIAAGRAGSPPALPNQQLDIPLRTKGRLSTPEEFEEIVIRAEPGGSLLRLGDVARVELGAQSYAGFTRLTGQPTVTMGVFQLPEANALEVSAAVRAELSRLSQTFPSGVEQMVRYDPTRFVSESVREVLETLFEAMILVFLVVFVFLQDWRATLIPAVTIPVSLIGTFAVLYAIGFGINTITLFALVLAIGLVVDDAIVVVENVARLLNEGYSQREAVLRSMGEVTSAIVAATLVLGAVFVPVALLPGTTGLLLRNFGLAVTVAVLISLLNALTLSPPLCALLMRREREHKNAFFRAFDRGFGKVVQRYDRGVRALLPRKLLVLGIFAVLFAANIVLFRSVPTGFIPDEDQGYFITSFQLPDGASIERTDEVAREVERILKDTPGVIGMNLFGGFDALTGTFPPNFGSVFVTLSPWDERTEKGQGINEIFAHVRPQLAAIPGARAFALNPTPIRGLSRVGGFEFQLQDRSGGSLEELANVTQRIVEAGEQSHELQNLFSSFRPYVPQIEVDLDRTKAKTLGVNVTEVFETLQAFMGGIYVNDFDRFGRLFRVFAQAEGDLRTKPEDVQRLWVRSDRGEMVPLSTLLSLQRISGPRDIPRYNGYRSSKIQGQAAPGFSSGQALDRMEAIARDVMPATMSFEWTGTAFQERQAGNETRIILALSLVVVFLFLAAQYESWSLPFAILLVVPLAFLGALGAQALRGLSNDIYCQIGLVTLIGLASKNSILIVEFARRRHAEGASLVDAAREAAEIRLRPVVMTAFAFILGVVPMVIATGAGSVSRHSLGTAVFGGMLVATVLSLVLVPALFVIVQGSAEWVRSRLRGEPSAAAAAEGART